jgi:poly(A) polymerase
MTQAPLLVDAPWLFPPVARAALAALANGGHQGWLVGGCVRNALIGAAPTDIDIATDATPDRVTALCDAAGLRVIPTGIAHGTVTVASRGDHVEVTTLRRDVETFGRHATVAFSARIEEDAARRDFTMNALYADATGAVTDPLGGLPDLLARRVRFIGNPHDRIVEDYLRILRFFRFHAWYADTAQGIDAEGLAACADHLDGLDTLSAERIQHEFRKLLSAPDPAPATAAMAACGALIRLLPGAGAHLLAVLVHVEEAATLAPDWLRRLAALGGEDPAPRLRLSRADAARLALLRDGMESETPPHELGYRLGATAAADILALRAALGSRELDPVQAQIARDAARQTFPVTAADLMPTLSGPALGQRLKALEDRWIVSRFSLSRADLLAPGP